MRIVGSIDHPEWKITIFRNDNRLSVKFESGLVEQTFKFRDGEGIDQVDDVHRLVDERFLMDIASLMQQMQLARHSALRRRIENNPPEDAFEVIV